MAIQFFVLCFLQLKSFGQSADEIAIRNVFKQKEEAWAAQDYAFTKYDVLDDSAFVINPVGMYWKNKTEIMKGLQYLAEVRFKYMKHIETKIVSIRFLSPSVALAIVWSKNEVIKDFTMPGEKAVTKKGQQFEGYQTETLIKRDNKWKISSTTVTEIVKW